MVRFPPRGNLVLDTHRSLGRAPAGALPQFFYTSTEFRPDDLWAAFWLLGLLVAVTGTFTVRTRIRLRPPAGPHLCRLLKTVVLTGGLLTATLLALALAWARGDGPKPVPIATRLTAILLGAVVPRAATVLYFARQGAFLDHVLLRDLP